MEGSIKPLVYPYFCKEDFMKKTLAILLALVVVGGAAFAQDAKPALTFGAYGDITATMAQNTDVTGYALYTETYFNYAAKDMGFSATTVASDDMFAAFRNYSIWYKPADMVKIYAGKLRETGSVRLTSYIDGNGFATRLANVKTGILVNATPVSGLVLNAFVPVTGVAYDTDYAACNFGGSYLIPDVANVIAGYRLENKELFAGVDVKAVKDLTLKVGYKYVDPTSTVFLTAAKTIDKLELGLDSNFVIASAFNYGAKVLAGYMVTDAIQLGVKASYDSGADAWYDNNGLDANPFAQINFAAGDIKVGFDYNLGKGTWSIPVDFELSF